MVKIEELSDEEKSSNADAVSLKIPKVESSDLEPVLEKGRTHSSASQSHLRSYFVGMGFSPILVDRVIRENGDGDANLLLESLFTYSALQKSSPKASDSMNGISVSENEDADSPIFTSDDEDTKEGIKEPANADLNRKKAYLLMMDFSEKEITAAINHLGEKALLTEVVDFILSAQDAECSKDKTFQEVNHESLFGTMDKSLCLLRMGFTETEISLAIDKLGIDVSIQMLADSILAYRMPNRVIKEEETQDDSCWKNNGQVESSKRYYGASEFREMNGSTLDGIPDFDDVKRIKKAKYLASDNLGASSSYHSGSSSWNPSIHSQHILYAAVTNSVEANSIKEEAPDQIPPSLPRNSEARWIKDEIPDQIGPSAQWNVQGLLSRPPYFFYGNVVDLPQDTWGKLSQFLYAVEPEFVNSQFFSAYIRKQGYIHNLPREDRFHIHPKPPMTIEDALPFTRKWWPSWDTRKQLSCINPDSTGVARLCERLGRMVMNSRGILSKEEQIDTLHQCRTSSLIWVGPNKLSPIDPDQLEHILGYPPEHTQVWGSEPSDRLRALRYSFQTDTVGYHLSVLKPMFPGGLRVLSIYSGIGGVEVALHRLGIRLRCVISVEPSDFNRKILQRWWQRSGQSGGLVQIEGVEMLTTQKLERLVREFGGFDLIVGRNPGTYASGSGGGDFSMGMDLSLFFEYVRVLQRVRGMIVRNN